VANDHGPIQVSNTWPIHPHGGPHRVLNPNILLYISIHSSISRYETHAPPMLNILYTSFNYGLERWSANIFVGTFPPKGTRTHHFIINNLQRLICQQELRQSFMNHPFTNITRPTLLNFYISTILLARTSHFVTYIKYTPRSISL
jgi:hypothetical protein